MRPAKPARSPQRSLHFETLESRLPFSATPLGHVVADDAGAALEPPLQIAAQQTVRVSDFGSLNDAIAAAGSISTRLIVDVTTQVNSSVDFGANIELSISTGGQLVHGSNRITIRGTFESERTSAFNGDGSVEFKNGSTDRIRARWFSGADTDMLKRAVYSASISEVKHIQLDGIYTINRNIRLTSAAHSGITISGEGSSTIVYVEAGNTLGVITFEVDGRNDRVENVTLENFVVDGNGAYNSQGIYTWAGLGNNGVYGIKVRNIVARNMGKTGFYFGGNVEGTNLNSHDNGMHGFVARDGHVVLDNIQSSRNFIGVDVAGGRDGYVTRAEVSNFIVQDNRSFGAKYGVIGSPHLSGYFTDGVLLNNAHAGFYSTYDAPGDFSNMFTSFVRVTASGNSNTGITLNSGPAYLEDVTANDNYIGVSVSNGEFVTTGKGISASDNRSMGIVVYARCQLSNVTATRNVGEGVQIRHSCDIIGGNIHDNEGFGVRTYGGTAVLESVNFGQAGTQSYALGSWWDSAITLRNTDLYRYYLDASSSMNEDWRIEHHLPGANRGVLDQPNENTDQQRLLTDPDAMRRFTSPQETPVITVSATPETPVAVQADTAEATVPVAVHTNEDSDSVAHDVILSELGDDEERLAALVSLGVL